jgi:hypothetical protein
MSGSKTCVLLYSLHQLKYLINLINQSIIFYVTDIEPRNMFSLKDMS